MGSCDWSPRRENSSFRAPVAALPLMWPPGVMLEVSGPSAGTAHYGRSDIGCWAHPVSPSRFGFRGTKWCASRLRGRSEVNGHPVGIGCCRVESSERFSGRLVLLADAMRVRWVAGSFSGFLTQSCVSMRNAARERVFVMSCAAWALAGLFTLCQPGMGRAQAEAEITPTPSESLGRPASGRSAAREVRANANRPLTRTLEATRVGPERPRLDGDLSDVAWSRAAVAQDFLQISPEPGAPARHGGCFRSTAQQRVSRQDGALARILKPRHLWRRALSHFCPR